MNTNFDTKLLIPNPYSITEQKETDYKPFLKYRIKYLSDYGEKILSMRFGNEAIESTFLRNFEEGLQKAVNVESVSIDHQHIFEESILNYVLNLRSIKSLEISNLISIKDHQLTLLQKLDKLQLLDLEVKIIDSSEETLKNLCSIFSPNRLEILRITLEEIDNDSFKYICTNMQIGASLKELSLNFGITKIKDKEFKIFQQYICKLGGQLENLKLTFSKAKIDSKLLAAFFTAIQKAKFNLRAFHFTASQEVDDKILKNIRAFIVSQKQLDDLQLSGLQIKQKILNAYAELLSCNQNVKRITGDIYQSKVNNTALSQIASSLSKLKDVQEVKLLFDVSSYMKNSLLELGECLMSLRELRDLRIEFPGSVKEETVKPFAEKIAQCIKLSYLYVLFQGQGDRNFVEFNSETPSSTIFENKSFKIPVRSNQNLDLKYQYNYHLFNLIIGNQFSNIEHFDYSTVGIIGKASKQFSQQVDFETDKLIEKCVNLKSLIYRDYVGYFGSLVKRNEATLKTINYRGALEREFLKFQLQNLIVLKCSDFNGFYVEELLNKFPDLIISNCVINKISLKESQALVSSNVMIWNLGEYKYFLVEDKGHFIVKECLSLRRSAIHLLFIYRKYLQTSLIYQQDNSHLDLWLD